MHVPPRSRGTAEVRAERSYIARKVILPVQAQIHSEEAGGVMLLLGTVIGLAWANSPWLHTYEDLIHHVNLTVDLAVISLSYNLHGWINDALMTLFFFLVSLEIKRELTEGQLSSFRKAAFPVMAAAGGMVAPAALFLLVTHGQPAARGWGIPVATDIAFAMGVLALLGRRVPRSLRVFLLTFAVADDIGGILIIALVYTEALSPVALAVAAGLILAVIALRAGGVQSVGMYTLVGVLLWLAMAKSGVHATIAGVILGLLTPAKSHLSRQAFPTVAEALIRHYRRHMDDRREDRVDTILGQFEELSRATEEPLERMMRILRPWVSYFVLPLFAWANAGVVVSGELLREVLSSPAAHGIELGLLIGKPLGVFAAAWLAVRLGWAVLPPGVNWGQITGVGLLAGIGFTISLFITNLAFHDERLISVSKLAVLLASLLAGAVGYVVLRVVSRAPAEPRPVEPA